MKKVILFAAVAMIGTSAFVSCGPSAEEAKKIKDSIDKMVANEMANIGKDVLADTAKVLTVDSVGNPIK